MELVNGSNNMDETIHFPSLSFTQNNKRSSLKSSITTKKLKIVNKSYLNSTEWAKQNLLEISDKLDETPEKNEFEFFEKLSGIC